MSANVKKSNLGKYEYLRGTTVKREVGAANPSKGIVGKGGGKTCNAPMDSDAEFEKRLKRYQRQQQAAAEAEAVKHEEAKADEPAEAIPA